MAQTWCPPSLKLPVCLELDSVNGNDLRIENLSTWMEAVFADARSPIAVFAKRIINVLKTADKTRRGFIAYRKLIEINNAYLEDLGNKEASDVFAAIHSLAYDMDRLAQLLLRL